jgi:hypothetical protein
MESPSHLTHIEKEERRRVFWSVYVLDRLAACGRGRPPAVIDACCSLQLPTDEETWRSGDFKETANLEQFSCRTLKTAQRLAPFAHTVVMAHTMCRGAQYMLQQFNIRNRDPPWDANSEFASIDSDLLYLESFLETWRSPAELVAQYVSPDGHVDQHSAGPAVFSRTLFHLCYCLIHHPFLLRRRLDSCTMAAPSSFLSRAFKTAWEHAKRMTSLLQEARKAGAIVCTSFYGYCSIVAGTIAAFRLHSSFQREAAELLQTIVAFVEDIGRFWKNVSSMAWPSASIAGRTIMTNIALGVHTTTFFGRQL